jgi:hypothetical protein
VTLAIREGAFVLTNFPFGPPDRPDQPGPAPNTAYCLAVRHTGQGFELILAYTSSGPWRPPGPTLPLGVMEFDQSAARALNQIPFHLDFRVLARVLPTPAWLPRIGTLDSGIIAWADVALRRRIAAQARNLAQRRPEVIEIRGVRPRR